MNAEIKSGLGISLAGLATFIALHGSAFAEGAQALWLFLVKITQDVPLGTGSFLLALVLATISQPMLRRWLPHSRANHTKHARTFLVEFVALVVGFGVMWALTGTMPGILLGLVAGFAAPFFYRAAAAAWALFLRKASTP
ncbi:hypothetical protein VDF70_11945 [Xanthomonas campestris pv. raphani]|uniref:hypothetical protein n=1 Tax=Xanthomonas campestris TaxID=339 RepID=UPI002B22A586|nr:hypothetical protein [Xanthomonas campestris]MEA9759764.1 hypothetical protein [Xanthomonas campestris pv. raphani]